MGVLSRFFKGILKLFRSLAFWGVFFTGVAAVAAIIPVVEKYDALTPGSAPYKICPNLPESEGRWLRDLESLSRPPNPQESEKVITLFEDVKNKSSDKCALARAHLLFGEYWLKIDPPKAEKPAEKAQEYYAELKMQRDEGLAWKLSGHVYKKMGDYEKACTSYKEAKKKLKNHPADLQQVIDAMMKIPNCVSR